MSVHWEQGELDFVTGTGGGGVVRVVVVRVARVARVVVRVRVLRCELCIPPVLSGTSNGKRPPAIWTPL